MDWWLDIINEPNWGFGEQEVPILALKKKACTS
jgi:hypothetical protein